MKQTLDDCLHTLTCSEGLFTYDIVKEVCLSLKNGVAGGPDMTTYEHIKFGGPVLWDILSTYLLEYSVRSKFHPSSRSS